MRPFSAIGLLAALSTVTAHTVFTTLFINDINQGDGTCIRMPKDGSTSTAPIRPITGTDMVCGRDGLAPVAFTCPAPAGSKLTFEFREYADASQPGALDPSHKGPCAIYLKQADNGTAAEGDGWFKIWEEGYDEQTGRWCTEKLIANNGLLSVALPSALPTGYFLVRPELLTLQQADKGDPQFYAGCAQLFVQGAAGPGTLDVPAARKVSIPGHVRADEKGLTFNIYDQKLALPYPIPGPAVFFPVLDSVAGTPGLSAAASIGGQAQTQQAQGAIPSDCLLKNANWCGFEVADYGNEDGCWAASADCFAQSKTCFDTAPATGSANCRVWERKCLAIQTACGARQFVGPPDKGVKLVAVEAAVPGPIPGVEGVAGTTVVAGGGSATGSPTATTAGGHATLSTVTVQATATATAEATGAAGAAPGEPDDSCPAEVVSKDGLCGGDLGQTCLGSEFGGCCSKYGRCGSTKLHCGCGCQSAFGQCN